MGRRQNKLMRAEAREIDGGPTLEESRAFMMAYLNRHIRFKVKIRALKSAGQSDSVDLEKLVIATNGICVELTEDFFPPNTTHMSIKFAIHHPDISYRLGVKVPPMPDLRWFDSELAVVDSEQFIDACLSKLEVCRANFVVDPDYNPPAETQLDERSKIFFTHRGKYFFSIGQKKNSRVLAAQNVQVALDARDG